ncbi:MAG: hypothetical protein WCP52_13590 [Bacteroidota bacterium]
MSPLDDKVSTFGCKESPRDGKKSVSMVNKVLSIVRKVLAVIPKVLTKVCKAFTEVSSLFKKRRKSETMQSALKISTKRLERKS